MPVMDGVEASRRLRALRPDIKLLILTTFDDDDYLRELFGIGVDGYLLKTDSPARLSDAVRNVYNGLGAVDGIISRKLGSLLNRQPAKPDRGLLTDTEKKVAALIAEGYYNKDIAQILDISYGRVRNLVSSVYAKLGVVSRADLISNLK
jgi:DNA-binding NarL/FixJ family response regulator